MISRIKNSSLCVLPLSYRHSLLRVFAPISSLLLRMNKHSNPRARWLYNFLLFTPHKYRYRSRTPRIGRYVVNTTLSNPHGSLNSQLVQLNYPNDNRLNVSRELVLANLRDLSSVRSLGSDRMKVPKERPCVPHALTMGRDEVVRKTKIPGRGLRPCLKGGAPG